MRKTRFGIDEDMSQLSETDLILFQNTLSKFSETRVFFRTRYFQDLKQPPELSIYFILIEYYKKKTVKYTWKYILDSTL